MKKLKHILEYLLFILLTRTLRLLSVDTSASLCSFIAKKIGPYLRVTKTARKNLKRVYGNETDIEKVINDLWDNYGRYIGEFPFINVLDSLELDKRVKVIGLEKVEAFKKANQPFILFLGHQANWDFVIRKINDIYPKFGIAYRKANNPYVDREILKERENDQHITMIAKGPSGAKSIIKAIKSGASLAMLVDQKMNNGIEVPFFGFPAMTAPALAKISLQYKYPIVPLQIVRIGKSSYFELILHDPLKPLIDKDIEKSCYNIMLEINKILEQWIREKPEQWFWFHNRWKN
ncbi:lipid A biosynthesis lauroyl acyltransferase [Candidatus Megaera venefica]|uniref:Lipid A biosynthesis lauroyl acyltransferase n=1 Tax=Candidatus Megaera venefica TaxID=2055910 RepID=A0ABU5NDS9_9RICK|nr:lipid A biosynthesis lauroyl acyltransferase [Candidatus Megaera venefica]MEA0971338.1 lipid A biosynthesis lauroyl acyltransferase [Candidatus Megaera venefica]